MINFCYVENVALLKPYESEQAFHFYFAWSSGVVVTVISLSMAYNLVKRLI